MGPLVSQKSNQHKAKSRSRFRLKKPSGISWQQQLADELYKPIKRNFTRQRVITTVIDKLWCSDLVEMQQFSKWNKGYRYLLMVLDLFSKYGWIVPLKDKTGDNVTEAFKSLNYRRQNKIYSALKKSFGGIIRKN